MSSAPLSSVVVAGLRASTFAFGFRWTGRRDHPAFSVLPNRFAKPSALRLAVLLRAFGSTLPACHEQARRAESNGGEGRTRTFEAARATDLQSAAFDRFATSPAVCCLETEMFSDAYLRKSG